MTRTKSIQLFNPKSAHLAWTFELRVWVLMWHVISSRSANVPSFFLESFHRSMTSQSGICYCEFHLYTVIHHPVLCNTYINWQLNEKYKTCTIHQLEQYFKQHQQSNNNLFHYLSSKRYSSLALQTSMKLFSV